MTQKMKTYKTYPALIEALKSGELSKHYYIMLDKGGMENSLNYFNAGETEEVNEAKQNECSRIFPNGNLDILDLFTQLGVRAEWC